MLVNEESRLIREAPEDTADEEQQPVQAQKAVKQKQSMDEKDAADREKVLEIVEEYNLTPQTISTSFLQRKLRLGYAKAARLKDWFVEQSRETVEEQETRPSDNE
jgi:DNA segregation ATPase FtsK/SpoIIIE-like protein